MNIMTKQILSIDRMVVRFSSVLKFGQFRSLIFTCFFFGPFSLVFMPGEVKRHMRGTEHCEQAVCTIVMQ